MSLIGTYATELTAIGSIFMNCATVCIIFFNLNQLKLNNRSLNVDINFKVFELRKKTYKGIINFIKNLSPDKGFRQYLIEQDNGSYKISEDFDKLKESIDNCKYLFSKQLGIELELLLLNIEQGISIEKKISELKTKNSSTWEKSDQEQMQTLGTRRNDAIDTIMEFKTDQFLPYLNISNFHKDLMSEGMEDTDKNNNLLDKLNLIKLIKKLVKFIKLNRKEVFN